MHVAELWRFPVKSMAAEPLGRAGVRPGGLGGDLGPAGLDERAWEGARLRIGDVVIGVQDLRQRCIMTTFDPDTLEQDTGVLHRINREFGGRVALNCYVVRPGTIAVGDLVELTRLA